MMTRILLTTLILAVVSSFSFSQDRHQIDSLRRKWNPTEESLVQLNIASDLDRYYWTYKPDSALFFAKHGLELARKLKLPAKEVAMLNSLSLTNGFLGNEIRALEFSLRALQVAEQNNINDGTKAESKMIIGNYYLIYSDESKQAFDNIYRSVKTFDSLQQKSMYDNVMLKIAIHNLGRGYLKLGPLDSALKYCKLAFDKMYSDPKLRYYNIEAKVSIINSLADVYNRKGNAALAMKYYKQSLSFSKENPWSNASTLFEVAKLHKQSNLVDSAIIYAKRSLAEAKRGGNHQYLIESSSLLSDLYEPIDIKASLTYRKTAFAVQDSVRLLEKQNAFINLTDFDAKERQYEIETATASYQSQVKIYSLLAGSGVFLLLAFILYRNSRKQKEAHSILSKQKQEIEIQKQELEIALSDLKSTQSQLIQSEKMASLGELTAGIAHEIQNPLNFVNNFSEVSNELIGELKTELATGNRELATELANDISKNLEKINHHGKRAADIVKSMLQHSRTSTGVKEPTDINALADEYLRLAFHGLRAKDKSFNATMKTDFDETIGNINVIPQDIGRVILNLITNAFYAVNEKSKQGIVGYEPTVSVTTKRSPLHGRGVGGEAIITVKDNGNGIPDKIKEKIFQPFFTTKPTGQGTGLGLSLSYDIVKSHGGELIVQTKEGEFTEFLIKLPYTQPEPKN